MQLSDFCLALFKMTVFPLYLWDNLIIQVIASSFFLSATICLVWRLLEVFHR